MDIKVRDFIISQAEHLFDLKKVVKSRRIGEGSIGNLQGEEYERIDEIGYSMTLDTCVKEIIHLTLFDRKDLVDMDTFINEYKKLRNEITMYIYGEPKES